MGIHPCIHPSIHFPKISPTLANDPHRHHHPSINPHVLCEVAALHKQQWVIAIPSGEITQNGRSKAGEIMYKQPCRGRDRRLLLFSYLHLRQRIKSSRLRVLRKSGIDIGIDRNEDLQRMSGIHSSILPIPPHDFGTTPALARDHPRTYLESITTYFRTYIDFPDPAGRWNDITTIDISIHPSIHWFIRSICSNSGFPNFEGRDQSINQSISALQPPTGNYHLQDFGS